MKLTRVLSHNPSILRSPVSVGALARALVLLLLVSGFSFDLPLAHAESRPSTQTSLPSLMRFSLDRRVQLEVVDDLESPLYSIAELSRIKHAAKEYLSDIEQELARVFRYQPRQLINLRLLSRAQYQKEIGSAGWANAFYYNATITAPLKGADKRSLRTLRRSLRHEYVHAACAELSQGRAPAWFEEGLAQLLEGRSNPRLAPEFRSQLASEGLLPFSSLLDGFTQLPEERVPAAYAQSLFAVRSLVNRYGFSTIRHYLELLGSLSQPEAFRVAFGSSESDFEARLYAQAMLWKRGSSKTL